MPPEDYYESNGRAFIVADGITRDPKCQIDLTDENLFDAMKYYPNPSGARFAAETTCQNFIKSIEQKNDVKNALIKANKGVKKT